MATSEAQVQTAVGTGCAIFKRMITNLEARISSERRRLAALAARLRTLEGQPNPDPAEVAQLKASIATLRGQINEDEDSLADVRIDFSMFCHG